MYDRISEHIAKIPRLIDTSTLDIEIAVYSADSQHVTDVIHSSEIIDEQNLIPWSFTAAVSNIIFEPSVFYQKETGVYQLLLS